MGSHRNTQVLMPLSVIKHVHIKHRCACIYAGLTPPPLYIPTIPWGPLSIFSGPHSPLNTSNLLIELNLVHSRYTRDDYAFLQIPKCFGF